MASPNAAEVLRQVEALTPEEQREVCDDIERLLKEEAAMSPLERRLIEEGLMLRRPDVEARRQIAHRPRIRVKGKPVSETIIEERR